MDTPIVVDSLEYVYAISMPDFVKIGHSNDVQKRLTRLQTGNPFTLKLQSTVVGGRDLESQIHDALRTYRVSGEWFSIQESSIQILRDFGLCVEDHKDEKCPHDYVFSMIRSGNDQLSRLIKRATDELDQINRITRDAIWAEGYEAGRSRAGEGRRITPNILLCLLGWRGQGAAVVIRSNPALFTSDGDPTPQGEGVLNDFSSFVELIEEWMYCDDDRHFRSKQKFKILDGLFQGGDSRHLSRLIRFK